MKILSYMAFMNFVLLLMCVLYGFENIKRSRLATPYIMLFTSLALWCLGATFFYVAPNENMATFWYGFSSLGWITFPAFSLHLFLSISSFLERENDVGATRKKRILVTIYLTPCILLIRELVFKKHILYTGITKSSLGLGWALVNTIDNTWSWLYIIYLSVYFIVGFYALKKWRRVSIYNSEKKHASIILLTCTITLILGMSTDIISLFWGDYLPPLANIFLIIAIIGTFFVMKKYKPFDEPDKIKARTVLNSINDPVIIFDAEYKLIKINKAVTTVLGYSPEELYSRELKYILENNQYNEENVKILFENKYIRNQEVNLLTADGKIRNAIYSATIVENEYNEFTGYIITFKDITDKKVIENQIIESNKKYKKLLEELSSLVKRDELTGLLNRDSFYRKTKSLIFNYHNFKEDFAIIFVDLNEFKAVNDSYGHNIGDEVIIESANRLEECTNENEVIFRMGGDEFIIILSKTPSQSAIREKIHAIRKIFSDKIRIDDLELQIGIALGYAVFSESNGELDIMIHKADMLMYEDKIRSKKTRDSSVDKGD